MAQEIELVLYMQAVLQLLNTKAFKLLLIILLLCGIIAGVLYIIKLNKKPQKVGTLDNILLAQVGDKKFYTSDIKALAQEQYIESAITTKVINIFLRNAVEEEILKQEFQKEGLTIPQSSSRMSKINSMRDQVTSSLISSREAFVIGWWLPPYNYPGRPTEEEKKLLEQQRKDTPIALKDIENDLKKGVIPLDAAQNAHKKYPSVAGILAVNGYILDQEKNTSIFTKPRLYTKDKEEFENTPIYTAIFNQKVNDIRTVISLDGAGGSVVVVKSSSEGSYKNYNQWYETMKKKYVSYYKEYDK